MPQTQKKISVGISACLLGHPVRFDGGHKQSRYCLDSLSQHMEFTPFCPEVAIGLPTPREPIRLVGDIAQPRVVSIHDTGNDMAAPLQAYADSLITELDQLSGYILMKRSPSCGMERVKIYDDNGIPSHTGQGVYAARIMRNHPAMPVEEEGRLNDPVLRENFIARVFAYHDWQQTVLTEPCLHSVLQFHSRYKYQLMAHSYSGYRKLGRYLGMAAPHQPIDSVLSDYIATFMAHLTCRANRKSHSNVLLHLLGYLKHVLDRSAKQDLIETIKAYRTAHVHLSVPLALINHYLKRYGNGYIQSQTYLAPYPDALGLRNAI